MVVNWSKMSIFSTGGQCQVQCLYHGPQQISNPPSLHHTSSIPLSRAYTPKLRSQNLVDILCLLKWWEAKIMCWFGQQLAGSRSRGHEKMLQAALITLHAVPCNYTWPLLGQQQSNVKLVYHFAMKTIQPTIQLPNDFILKLNLRCYFALLEIVKW